MSKIVHYSLLLMILIVPTGCATVHGMGEDIHNACNPDMNGWNVAKKADVWIQENLW